MPPRKTIEDIILSHDKRGISALRAYLPARFCEEAAQLIHEKSRIPEKTALITSGFYIPQAKSAETDGPLGAFALSRALKMLEFKVVMVTDKYSHRIFKLGKDNVVKFPITDDNKSLKYAYKLLGEYDPAIMIAVERCGVTRSGRFLNMRGKDISAYNARVDYLFLEQENTIGIGDGGNEIGMGNLADKIQNTHNLPAEPAVTPVKRLVIASVSNWGAYGLIAALSLLTGRNLLPSVEWEKKMLRTIVDRGAVDGISGEKQYSVDGFDEEGNAEVLAKLNRMVQDMVVR
jgi:hypothetical protein